MKSFTYQRHSLVVIYILIGINLLAYILLPTLAFLFKTTPSDLLEKVQLSHSFTDFYNAFWKLITYAFFHLTWWHLFFNMILLYFAGILFMNLFSAKQFLKIYFLGIVVGGLFFMISHSVFPVFSERKSYLLGSSAGIMSVLIFVCTYTPFYKIKFLAMVQLPLWVLGVGLVLIDLVSIPLSNSGGKMAHLGGAFCGFLWAYSLKYSFIPKKKNLLKPRIKTKQKSKLTQQELEYKKKVDVILSKISKSGYESLSDAEKHFLFNASKHLE